MKNILFASEWSVNSLQSLWLLGKEIKIDCRNQVIAREDTECNKVYVVLSGEVEVVRTNLTDVFVNTDNGALAIAEQNVKKQLIRSSAVCEENYSLNTLGGIS